MRKLLASAILLALSAPALALPPSVDAGSDQVIADTDCMLGGESAILSAIALDDGSIVSYEWRRGPQLLGTGPSISAALMDGINDITVTVTDDEGLSASDTVRVTTGPTNTTPTITYSPASLSTHVYYDTDGIAGEVVTLSATINDPSGLIAANGTTWTTTAGVFVGTGNPLSVRLSEGSQSYRLLSGTGQCQGPSATGTISVFSPLTIDVGADRSAVAGQPLSLAAPVVSPAGAFDAPSLTYSWSLDGVPFSSFVNPSTPAMAAGVHTIAVAVTSGTGRSYTDSMQVTAVAPIAPNVSLGADRSVSVSDTNGFPGEFVTINSVVGFSGGAYLVSYSWVLDGAPIAAGSWASISRSLPDGVHNLTLMVTDSNGAVGSDSVQITVAAAAVVPTVTVNDLNFADSDGAGGEVVVLSATIIDPSSQITSIEWRLSSDWSLLGTGPSISTSLPDGSSAITLVATYGPMNMPAFSTAVISVAAASTGGDAPENAVPTANAGIDQSLVDSDGQNGELVTLTGSGFDTDGTISGYEWLLGNEVIASQPSAQVHLNDGSYTLTLRVTDNANATATDQVQISIGAAIAPTADAGIAQSLVDSDRADGEFVTLTGSATTAIGTILSYQWFEGDVLLGSENPFQVRLTDGSHTIRFVVRNSFSQEASSTVAVTIAAPRAASSLADLPGLSDEQRPIADTLDRICNQLTEMQSSGQALTSEQRGLFERCAGLNDATPGDALSALGKIVNDSFSVARLQTLLFSTNQHIGVTDRLSALRGGARGFSLAELGVQVDGQQLPMSELSQMIEDLYGDDRSRNARGDSKLGVWMRGNWSDGRKSETQSSPGADANQFAFAAGTDYRLYNNVAIGGAFALGDATVGVDRNDGSLHTRSQALSVYGSVFNGRRGYIDGVMTWAHNRYDVDRNILYVDGFGLVDDDARGKARGDTISSGLSAGYDLQWGRLAVSPSISLLYIDAQIESFRETSSSGLGLAFEEQEFSSFTWTTGLRANWVRDFAWGSLLPHARLEYVRDMKADHDTYGARFTADPLGQAAPVIRVQTNNADRSYWRMAIGISADFKPGFSLYADYQSMEGYDSIDFSDLSVGLRWQRKL